MVLETIFLLTFAAFVLLAGHFVDKLEKEDEDGYNSEQGATHDDT